MDVSRRSHLIRNAFVFSSIVIALLSSSPVAAGAADLVPQIQSLEGDCGADVLGQAYGNCTAGEISISSVDNVVFEGGAITECVRGEDVVISSATVSYSINTGSRNDLIMWIADQEGVDPRGNAGVGATCSAYSLPGTFTDTPTLTNPFNDEDGDQCGDIGLSTDQASRTFTNLGAFECQDSDMDGKADNQILLTWSQNANQACGTGMGQSFPTTGAKSKCDYQLRNSTLNIVFPPILVLVKQVTNNSGGTEVPGSWTLTATGANDTVQGTTGVSAEVDAGDYVLSEMGPGGYTGTWQCVGANGNLIGDTVTLDNVPGPDPGDAARTVTCTLTNDDQPANLTLVKNVSNLNGGMALPTAWTLSATGPTPITGAGGVAATDVNAGVYQLTETPGPAGYMAGAWQCTGDGQLNGSQLTLANGDTAVCTITNSDIPASLTLNKTVLNNNGGMASAGQWTLSAGAVDFTSGQTQDMMAGLYTLSESGPAGYAPTGPWQCTITGNGSFTPPDQLTLALGDTVTCGIINEDQPATLTLAKTVQNNSGGMADPDEWTLTADGASDYMGNTTQWMGGMMVAADTYLLSESGPSGYTAGDWQCSGDGVFTPPNQLVLALGESASCTIENTDQAPTLTLLKSVSSGSATADEFTLTLQGADGVHDSPQNYSSGAMPVVQSNVTYTIDELAYAGMNGGPYANQGVACTDGNGSVPYPVTLNPGQAVTCTLTNEEVASGSFTVIKDVDTTNGGNAVPGDFDLRVVSDDVGVCTQDGNTPYSSGDAITPDPVDGCVYTVGELQLPGYDQVGDVTCIDAANGNAPVVHPVTFANGQSIVCTISNASQAANLTLVKSLNITAGGMATEDDWTLSATGAVNMTPVADNTSGWVGGKDLPADTYTLSESGPAGYSVQTDWVCTGDATNTGDQIVLGLGESATCTIVNTDAPATLTLAKQVINLDGGDAAEDAWDLVATGNNVYSEVSSVWAGGLAVAADTYTLSEINGPDGYSAGDWQCSVTGTGSFTPPDQLTLELGDSASCLIINDDIAPQLTLVKSVTNDNGGEVDENGFTLTLLGVDGTHDTAVEYGNGAMPMVQANVIYTVDEVLVDGYENLGVTCVEDGDGGGDVVHPVTLALGQAVTCTVSNDDIAPTLTLLKDVTNDDGGTLEADAFTLTLTGVDDGTHDSGADYFSGDMPVIFGGTEYTVSEDTVPDNYELIEPIVCIDTDTQAEIQNPFTPLLGQNISCTVENDDVPPTLTLVKDVTNDQGGTLDPSEFPITLTGVDTTHDSGVDYADGDMPDIRGEVQYTVSETPPSGYELVVIECRDVTGADVGSTFTAVSGDDITCTVFNDDTVSDIARFTVTKDFTDDNPGSILVQLTCNTGADLIQEFEISEGADVTFVNTAFESGSMDCWVEEISGGTEGYTPSYTADAVDGVAGDIYSNDDSCYYEAVEGGEFTCELVNTLDTIDISVTKEWLGMVDDIDAGFALEAVAKYTCYNVRTEADGPAGDELGTMSFSGVIDTQTIPVYPNWNGESYCEVTEILVDSGVDSDDSACANLPVTPGADAACTIYNTVFFEGIPTLNQYTLALLALLMLGMGAVGIRRFV